MTVRHYQLPHPRHRTPPVLVSVLLLVSVPVAVRLVVVLTVAVVPAVVVIVDVAWLLAVAVGGVDEVRALVVAVFGHDRIILAHVCA